MKKLVLHVVGNAHIDPVWMWDWRTGLTEGIRTSRSVLALMDEYPELTYIRGESALYEHIEKRDPETFHRITERIKEGRWDIVGGQYVQPDNNMPSTRTALRQFAVGREYFREKFGREINIAWLADAFGHGRGTPEVFTAAGMKYFAMTRPQERICPIGSPVFRWIGQGGSELLCVRLPSGVYGIERSGPGEMLNQLAEELADAPVREHLVTFGLGDHGGGPTREHIDMLLQWREDHPEVTVKFSTFTEYFRVLETIRQEIPEFHGEINFCQRGCYSSTMKFKHIYRKAEARIERAEKTSFLTSAEGIDTDTAKAICFNSFHDILPGTSVERAMMHQKEWLGGAIHSARKLEFAALTALGSKIDTTVPPRPGYNLPEASPYVIFNPTAHAWKGLVEIDFQMDSRPVWNYCEIDGRPPVEVRNSKGELLHYQLMEPESHALKDIPPWRRRVLFEMELPPSGWGVATLGYDPKAAPAPAFEGTPASVTADGISNGFYTVKAGEGTENIVIKHGSCTIPLRFALFADPTGSWGDMSELPENSHTLEEVEQWKISKIIFTENGPLRAAMWIQLQGKRSTVELTCKLSAGRDALDMNLRAYWFDRGKRLKMLMPQGDWVDFDVPGGVMRRKECASVPGGRHQRVYRKDGVCYALLSDTVFGFENEGGNFAAVIARGCRHSTDEPAGEFDHIEHPVADAGELVMNFIIAPFDAPVNTLAEELELPPIHWLEATHPGSLPRSGSCGLEMPEGLQWIGVEEGLIIVQNRSANDITWQNRIFKPWKIERINR